ncbi:hypothetical protein FH972_004478 [Carpinus fangiana]|uniref:Uncharacterized protein n=1 Tax=Carpinus fangiana TaxID=176857 RepID=A0A5N6QL91_9ROSI|nr:hypothetical protein FH972_004478 [Carpinus fangiana]
MPKWVSITLIDLKAFRSSPREFLFRSSALNCWSTLFLNCASLPEDAKVLDRINEILFIETHLHCAASAGHTQFAMEIVRLKPIFAKKLNQHGFTPIHVALQNNQDQVLLQLLDVDENFVRVQGRECVTPLHYVAEIRNLHLLAKFLKVCPETTEDVIVRKETVLHIALKNNMFDAVELVLGMASADLV